MLFKVVVGFLALIGAVNVAVNVIEFIFRKDKKNTGKIPKYKNTGKSNIHYTTFLDTLETKGEIFGTSKAGKFVGAVKKGKDVAVAYRFYRGFPTKIFVMNYEEFVKTVSKIYEEREIDTGTRNRHIASILVGYIADNPGKFKIGISKLSGTMPAEEIKTYTRNL